MSEQHRQWASTEFEKLFVKPRKGLTLIVGSYVTAGKIDRRSLYPNVFGVDMRHGPGVDVVLDMEEPVAMVSRNESFAHVDCLSVLEHSKRPWLMAANIERLLRPKGSLFLSVPFVWRIHAHPNDYWRFTTTSIPLLFPNIEWQQLMYVNHQLDAKPNAQFIFNEWGYKSLPRTEVMGFGYKKKEEAS